MTLVNKRPVLRLTFLGLSLALYIALSFVTIRLPGQEITFKGLAIILPSVVGGPIDGVFVAISGEFINQLVGPYGLTPTTPLWILPHVLRALIIGFMMKHKDPIKDKFYWAFVVILSGIVVTLTNSFVIWIDALIFEYPSGLMWLTIFTRAAATITTSIIYIIVIPLLIKPLIKLNKIK